MKKWVLYFFIVIFSIIIFLILRTCVWYGDSIFNDTKDWLTYRNEEYGFEFKYPKEYEITNNKNVICYKSVFCISISKEKIEDAPHEHFFILVDRKLAKSSVDVMMLGTYEIIILKHNDVYFKFTGDMDDNYTQDLTDRNILRTFRFLQ